MVNLQLFTSQLGPVIVSKLRNLGLLAANWNTIRIVQKMFWKEMSHIYQRNSST
jgi:hypothetical protein